jgi:sugar lactone lactonase YvrE
VSSSGDCPDDADTCSSGQIRVLRRDVATGAIVPVDPPDGCVRERGEGGCRVARASFSPVGLALSPDGSELYSADSFGLAVFARDAVTGSLTQ